jgi:hypothetical protein
MQALVDLLPGMVTWKFWHMSMGVDAHGMNAAFGGCLDVLGYAQDNGCPWNAAAENGQLDVLKYAYENGCPWDDVTCYYAAFTVGSLVVFA